MFKAIKRILTAATVVLAATGPSVAYARFNIDPPRPSVSTGQARSAIVPSVARTAAASSHGFEWDDAGIGAAGVLALLSVGSGAVVARRRRMHHPLTS